MTLLQAREIELGALRGWMFDNPEKWVPYPSRVRALLWTTRRHEEEIRRLRRNKNDN
jgi:hypothetical protein